MSIKFSLIPQGTAPRNNTDYSSLASIKQEIIEKAFSKALPRLNILRKHREIVNGQTQARNSRKQFTLWERCDGHFPNRHKHEFNRISLFALTRQEMSSMRTRM